MVSTIIGVLLGWALAIMAEPIKARLQRREEMRVARREIYSELAGYVASMERVKDLQFDEAKDAVTMRPRFDALDWYKSHQFDLLLRLDPSRGLRLLCDSILHAYEHANNPRNATFGLPTAVVSIVANYETKIDVKLLRKYIEGAHAEWQLATGTSVTRQSPLAKTA